MRDPNEVAPNGLTFGEIDAREAESIRRANETLANLHGLSARWWGYSVSHCTFDMIVGDPLGRDANMAICCPSTNSLRGPVCWDNQQLRVEWDCDSDSAHSAWSYRLVDGASGFLLESNMFLWRSNFDLHANGSLWLTAGGPKRSYLEYVCPTCQSASFGHTPFCAQCGRELPSESKMFAVGLTRPVRDPASILERGSDAIASDVDSGTFNSDTNQQNR